MKTYVVVDASKPDDRTYIFIFQTSSEIKEGFYGFGVENVITDPNHLKILKHFGIKFDPKEKSQYISIHPYRYDFPTLEFENEKS